MTALLIAVILKEFTFVCWCDGWETSKLIESKSFEYVSGCGAPFELFGALSPAAVGHCKRSSAGEGAGATRAPAGRSAL